MPHRPRAALAAALLLAAPALRGQTTTGPRQVTDNTSAWFTYSGDHPFAPRWGLLAELQTRRAHALTRPLQLLARWGIARTVAPGTSLAAGYGFEETWPYGGLPAPDRAIEHQLWEQLQLAGATGRVAWQHRYRLEQRWIDVPLARGVRDWRYSNRVRYLARGTVPLRGPTLDVGEPYVMAYDEVFVGWGRNVGRNILDQNRLGAVLGWRLSAATRLEGGYLYQLVLRPDAVHVERNHTLLLTVVQGSRLRH